MDPAPDLSGIKDHLYAAVIADILDDLGYRDQVMSAEVRPMLHDTVVVGRARTMLATPRFEDPDPPYQVQIEAVDALETGDVVVAHLSGITDAAFWGELFSAAAKARGAVGAVMDGYIRDTRKVLDMGYPLFATGIRPINSKGRLTVEAYDTPVRCGGVLVHPGDIVFAEVDGVVVVPGAVADQVFMQAAEVAQKENLMRAELDNGLTLKAAWDKHRVLQGDRTLQGSRPSKSHQRDRMAHMRLTKHYTPTGPRWAADGALLVPGFSLGLLAQAHDTHGLLRACSAEGRAEDTPLLPPIDDNQEVWAAGVTYLRSKDARIDESDIGARLYQHIYESERPELFFKSPGYRCVTDGQPIRVRRDSDWDVPEPEMTLFINSRMQILGYTAGNDVSSRSIEGENALYLPQAKIFDGCSAIGPGIQLVDPDAVTDLPIRMRILRNAETVYDDQTSTAKMKQKPADLAAWVGRELSFPSGLMMMTGTGIVPENGFTLIPGDEVRITVGSETLANPVAQPSERTASRSLAASARGQNHQSKQSHTGGTASHPSTMPFEPMRDGGSPRFTIDP